MANIVLASADTIITGTAIKNSENASYPASNIADYTHPFRVYKATGGTAAEYVGYDYGASKTIYTIFVDRVNSVGITIEADDAATFNSDAGSPQYSSGSLTPTYDYADGRYKYCLHNAGSSLFANRRYMRVKNSGGAVFTYDSVFSVGSIVSVNANETLAFPTAFPFDTIPVTPTIDVELACGAHEPTSVGNVYCEFNLSLPVVKKTSGNWQDLGTLAATNTNASIALLFVNQGDPERAYLVRRIGSYTISQTGPNSYSAGTIKYREVV